MELFLDGEISDAVDARFGISKGLDRNDPHFGNKRYIALYRFLGYDHIRATVDGLNMVFTRAVTADTEQKTAHKQGRSWMNEQRGPIASWEDFEKYPWPNPKNFRTDTLEWFEKNLPDDMCIIASGGHWCEYLVWLFGYETLCYAFYDDRKLVEAVYAKIDEIETAIADRLLGFSRIKCMWGSDDMGFKTGPLFSPADMREFVFSGHKKIAQRWHATGRPYILHACGNRATILDDLINDVKIDAIHSFEDTIEKITDAKRNYGKKLSLIGGIDVDFLCGATEEEIRARVRRTIDICQPGGGFALGTGNSVANYIPVENYLTMLDEGRRYGG
jgi:uroporphyrinogen decarboxylase